MSVTYFSLNSWTKNSHVMGFGIPGLLITSFHQSYASPCNSETAHDALLSGGHLTSSNTLYSFSNQNSAFYDSSMLDPSNSSAPCLLTVSIGALGAINLSNTRAMSCDILNKASVDSLGTLLSEGSEADNSCSLGLTFSTASSRRSIYTKHKDIHIRGQHIT